MYMLLVTLVLLEMEQFFSVLATQTKSEHLNSAPGHVVTDCETLLLMLHVT